MNKLSTDECMLLINSKMLLINQICIYLIFKTQRFKYDDIVNVKH